MFISHRLFSVSADGSDLVLRIDNRTDKDSADVLVLRLTRCVDLEAASTYLAALVGRYVDWNWMDDPGDGKLTFWIAEACWDVDGHEILCDSMDESSDVYTESERTERLMTVEAHAERLWSELQAADSAYTGLRTMLRQKAEREADRLRRKEEHVAGSDVEKERRFRECREALEWVLALVDSFDAKDPLKPK